MILITWFTRDILLLIGAFQAENEYLKIKSRQAQGIAVAKVNGKKLGRPKSTPSEKEIEIIMQYQSKEITLDTALNLFNLKKSAFYNLCKAVKKI